jgi:hypothetical protein
MEKKKSDIILYKIYYGCVQLCYLLGKLGLFDMYILKPTSIILITEMHDYIHI